METRKSLKFIFPLILAIFVSPVFCFGYANETTHPALSNETIDIFNYYYPDLKITIEERSFVLEGSKKEDEPEIRCVNHFYDPVNDKGLLGVNISAKNWAQRTNAQAGISNLAGIGIVKDLFSAESDYSWDRAIYDYVYGDQNRAFEALGHTLHLLQDMSVPPHVRDDQHMTDASPYETFTKQFDKNSISDLSDVLIAENKNPVVENRLDDYFYKLAKFTNGNFFSRSTINKKEYGIPEIVKSEQKILTNGDKVWFDYENVDGKNNKLVAFRKNYNQKSNIIYKDYFINDVDHLVLRDYWSILSKQAVLHGAGVIKLFFDEAEKEKQTLTLYNKNKSFFTKIEDKIANILTKDEVVSGNLASVSRKDSERKREEAQKPQKNEENREIVDNSGDNLWNNRNKIDEKEENRIENIDLSGEIDQKDKNNDENEENKNKDEEERDENEKENNHNSNDGIPSYASSKPINQSDNEGSGNNEDNEDKNEEKDEENQDEQIIIIPPTITTPENFQTFNTNTITFSGTASSTNIISTNFSNATTTANENQEWTLILNNLNQGTTTISFFASNETQTATSTATNIEIFVDSEVPNITLTTQGCENSISQTNCLITTNQTFIFNWESTSADLDYYILNLNNTVSTTTATTTQITLTENQNYIFSVKAVDKNGNESEEKNQIIQINTSPVVINEIAWMGTKAFPYDEWIELYNNTDEDIDLENWVLYSEDQTPYISLSKTIPAKGYYLLERTDNDTINNIDADLIYTGDLGNTGENLNLVFVNNNATTTVDQILKSNNWNNKGSNELKYTMERIDSNIAGTDWDNWSTNIGKYIINGRDAGENKIYGTPKTRNSTSHLVVDAIVLNEDKILTKANSPYIIKEKGLEIPENITLTIEEGVVVKILPFYNPRNDISGFLVRGNLIVNGTTENPVVFTSIYDDEFGGDTNMDGMCEPNNVSSTAMCPQKGDWRQIVIKSTSKNSSFNNTKFSYGGNNPVQGQIYSGMVVVENTNINIDNSIFDNSLKEGLNLFNPKNPTNISNSIFRNNTGDTNSYGLYLEGYAEEISPNVSNNTFENNDKGAYFNNSSAIVYSNIFNNNSIFAVKSQKRADFQGNSGSGNGKDGICLFGDMTEENQIAEMKTNSLPYIMLDGSFVVASSTLKIQQGVVMNFDDARLDVYGRLETDGVIFDTVNNTRLGTKNGVYFKPESTSYIKNSEFNNMYKAVSYESSSINLDNVIFRNNEWAVFADGNSVVETANSIIFDDTNTATSTIPLF